LPRIRIRERRSPTKQDKRLWSEFGCKKTTKSKRKIGITKDKLKNKPNWVDKNPRLAQSNFPEIAKADQTTSKMNN